ncbi:MAG TPA: DUF6286 domain-containing protein [Aldersonia sp.]
MSPPVPSRTPVVAWAAVAVGVLFVGAAFVAGREFLIAHEVITGEPWLADLFGWVATLSWERWLLYAGIVAIVLGVALLVVAVWPRRGTHLPTSTTPVLWLRATDAARASTAAAEHVDGVARAHSSAGPRSVQVHVVAGSGESAQVAAAVHAQVTRALAPLESPPSVKVVMERGR